MKTIIYLRTSTEEQNPENQLSDCLSINKWGDYELYLDKQSAWKEHIERKGFEQVLKLIKKGAVYHLIVWDLDRVYRNRTNLLNFIKLCDVKKCKIHSFRQQWLEQINDIPSPWNEILHDLMIQVMGWMAQDESDKKSKRVRAAIRVKDDGAYSYKGNKWGRREISTQAMNKIISLRKEGKSIREICRTVTYSTKSGQKNVSVGLVHKILSGNHRKKSSSGDVHD